MADVLLEGKSLREHPIFSLGFTSVSPLRWPDSALDVFRVSSGYGIPLMVNSEVISGATGPVTLAGTLALANAEALSGVTIAQLLEPARPVVSISALLISSTCVSLKPSPARPRED